MPPLTQLVLGEVVTMDPSRPRAEAIGISNGLIVAVGDETEVRGILGAVSEIRHVKGTLVPGLIDTHNHMHWTGMQSRLVDLSKARSIADIQAAIRIYAKSFPEDAWISSGSGWHVVNLIEQRYPTRQELDEACSDRPIYLPRVGHAAVANTMALGLAGIHPSTPDPEGGKILRDNQGVPNGILMEPPAFELVAKLVPPVSVKDQEQALRDIQKRYHAAGLTGIMDPGVTPEMMRIYQSLWSRGELTVRSVLMPLADSSRPLEEILVQLSASGMRTGFGDTYLKLGGIKLFLDGGASLGTALMREPYPDERCNCGIQVTPTDTFRQIAKRCAEQGWSMGVHVVGGQAIDIALDVFTEINETIPIHDLRFSLIHAYLWPEARNIRQAAQLGVTVATQCSMQYTFGPILVQRFGVALMALATPVRSWLDGGVKVGGGSDSPVTPFEPLLGLWQARSRCIAGSKDPVGRLQAVSGEEALALYTRDAAYLSFSEKERGMIKKGLLADFTVLSVNPVECEPEALQTAEILGTAVGGVWVYEK